MSAPPNFEGHTPRDCGVHIWVDPASAWCIDCARTCYRDPAHGCEGCQRPIARAGIAALDAEAPRLVAELAREIQWSDVPTLQAEVVRLRGALAAAEAKVAELESDSDQALYDVEQYWSDQS